MISISLINKVVQDLPSSPGVYKMLNNNGEVLYVGKAKNLAKRVQQYAQIERLPNRLRLMVSLISKIEIIVTSSEAEALRLEADLIKGLNPKYNIALKDDKSFPYIAIDLSHSFPRIFKYRGNNKKYSLFGPFVSVHDLEEIIIAIQQIFKVRTCTNRYFTQRQRPCLLYQILRCSAPCVQLIAKQDYLQGIKDVKRFLSGNVIDIRNKLIAEMEMASENTEFEKAAALRDQIKAMNKLSDYELYKDIKYKNIDVFALYVEQMRACIQMFSFRDGKNIGNSIYLTEAIGDEEEILSSFVCNLYTDGLKPDYIAVSMNVSGIQILKESVEIKILNIKKIKPLIGIYNIAKQNAELYLRQALQDQIISDNILQNIQQIFSLNTIPTRIEVYDNSHIQGKHAVGCMVVSDGRSFLKGEYRAFKMRADMIAGDDYAMMREMLTRRFSKLDSAKEPSFVMIDGGGNHLSVALDVLKNLQLERIRVVAIAKGVKRNAGLETLFLDDGQVLNLPHNNQSLYFLQRLRDEAHRFAITTHRKIRDKTIISSLLIDIPGIGAARRKILLTTFGSYVGVQSANLKDLENTQGIGKKFASRIYSYLHDDKHS